MTYGPTQTPICSSTGGWHADAVQEQIEANLFAHFVHPTSMELDYDVGSLVRVILDSGKEVDARITAITMYSAGPKVRIVYGDLTELVVADQIVQVLE